MWCSRLPSGSPCWPKARRWSRRRPRTSRATQRYAKPIWARRRSERGRTQMNETATFDRDRNSAATHPKFLSVWDIQAYYGESYIVQGVSFDIHEGEILALLGRNGAGKTSTLRTIARLDNPALRHGEIWLAHKPLHKMK